MAGVLDTLSDPVNQGLLSLSSGLLQAGGPQRFPVGFGQGIGQGVMQGLGTLNTANQNLIQRRLLEEEIRSKQFANQRAGIQGQLLQQILQGGAPSGGALTAQPTPQGISQGSLSAYGVEPGSSQAMALSTPQAPAQAAPAQNGYFNPQDLFNKGLLFNAAGLQGGSGMMTAALAHDPNIAGQVSMAQKGYVSAPNGGVMLTPGMAEESARQKGLEAEAGLPAKSIEAFLHGAGRSVVLNPTQSATSGYNALPTFIQDRINGLLAPQAPAGGATYSIAPPGGGPIVRGAAATPDAAIGAVRQGTGLPEPVVTNQSMVRNGVPAALSPLQQSSQQDRAKQLETYGESLSLSAQNAVKDNATIANMRSQSGGFNPGKLAPMKNEIGAYLLEAPWFQKMFPNAKDSVAAYQEFEKNATMLSTTAARAMGAREPGSVIAMFKNAFPNASLTDNTLSSMFAQIHGMNDYNIAMQKAADEWRNSPKNMDKGTLAGFQSEAAKILDPQVFIYRQMPPEVQRQFAASLNPGQRKVFANKVAEGLASGLVPPTEQ